MEIARDLEQPLPHAYYAHADELGTPLRTGTRRSLSRRERKEAAAFLTEWKSCRACRLCDFAHRHVTFRGSLPCNVLFVGGAPSEVEDGDGLPFIGEPGRIMDRMILDAKKEANLDFSVGLANVVACLPKEPGADKPREPKADEAKACAKNLQRLVDFAKPEYVVAVGVTAARYVRFVKFPNEIDAVAIEHPASLLRKQRTQEYEASYFRAVMKIAESVSIPF
jgi:uracil-DNA glycosylase family 4